MVRIDGQRAVIVGRSNIVGRPMAFLLMQHHATVSVCHSRTQPLGDVTREADILCVAIGRPRLIKADMIKSGAVVIDVAINRVPKGLKEDGTPLKSKKTGKDLMVTCGDVEYEKALEVASQITPVPGGVGPMTVAMLLQNTVNAAKANA